MSFALFSGFDVQITTHRQTMPMNSIVTEEIDHFNRLAETWWDDAGPMWPLHRLNALRAPFILRHMQSHFACETRADFERLQVLDVGCGGGILSESIAQTGARVLGIDAAERNIQIASQHASGQLPVQYQHRTIESLDPREQFDVVLNMEVVEHVADVESFMADCARRTRPGGLMFVATINRTLYAAVTAILGAEYILGWLPRGTHQRGKFVKPAEVLTSLSVHDFELIEQTGVAVNPLKKSMSLTGFMGGNYMLVARRLG
jgi:2-polyprenyl-6-hydroxyphenyl methylase/3-demethylubiquinone-9 3-methyltransferase